MGVGLCMQTKLFIKNRKGQRLVVLVDTPENPAGLAFVVHGLGGFKEQPHIQLFADVLCQNGYTTIRYDAADTIGESGGKMENATTTSYYEDLEDVIAWAKTQAFYKEPFVLVGHSLGGISSILYAEKHSGEVRGLAPVSSVISGKLHIATYPPELLKEWQARGYIESESISKPGIMKKIGWRFIEDGKRYDVLPEAAKLTMPVLLIVGDKDTATPLAHQKMLYEKLPGKRELYIIKNAEHNFRDKHEFTEIKAAMSTWLAGLHSRG